MSTIHTQVNIVIVLMMFTFCPTVSQTLYGGTTVIAFRTPDSIFVGADSRMTNLDDPTLSRACCKIRKIGNTFFAFAGVTEFQLTGFNLPELAIRACQKRGNIFQKAEEFERLAVEPLAAVIGALYAEKPTRILIPRGYDIGIVFCAVENGIPVMAFRKFIPILSPSGFKSIHVDKVDCPGPKVPIDSHFIAMLGHRELAKQHLEDKGLFDNGIPAGIRKLIQYEIDANPQAVGPPIEILAVGNNGVEWIDRKPNCFEGDQ